ncbi:hypothetical protein I4U23_020963 [Adineta vaga]|nr:hypothetical protein I4U23_020963 [Adineta vaga]
MLKSYEKKRLRNESNDKKTKNRSHLGLYMNTFWLITSAIRKNDISSDNDETFSQINLQKCSVCNRSFDQIRLLEHERACNQTKKFHLNSSHYDSQFHRWKGLNYYCNRNEFQSFLTKHITKTHWREKHQEFQYTMKGAFDPMNNLVEKSTIDPRSYQCRQCQRKFATQIAQIKHQKGCHISNKRHLYK